jgi:hypothetical protein
MVTTGAVLTMFVIGAFNVNRPARAVAPPAMEPAQQTQEQEAENDVPVDDEMIVTTLIHMQKILQRTAAVGTAKASTGPIRTEARRVHSDIGTMLSSLQAYGRQRGYQASAAEVTASRQANPEFEEFLSSLHGLEVEQFNPAYMTVLRDFLEQMTSIVEGATELATDPKLKTMLGGMQRGLGAHQQEFEMLLRLPPVQ